MSHFFNPDDARDELDALDAENAELEAEIRRLKAMSGSSELRFVSTKGWVAPETCGEHQKYISKSMSGNWNPLFLRKGEDPNDPRFCGPLMIEITPFPITILPPEPELELLEGWEIVADCCQSSTSRWLIAVIRKTGGCHRSDYFEIYRPTRPECVTVINRMVKAAEGK